MRGQVRSAALEQRFVKPSAGICPPAAASLLPRAWRYSKKPVELAELPGFLIQPRVAARRGKRPLVGNARALLGSEEAGAVPTEMGRLGSGWGDSGRVTVGSPAAIPGDSLPPCPIEGCWEPLALPGGLGVLTNPQGPVFIPRSLILSGGAVMLLPAGGCCAGITVPTPLLAWGRESPVLLGALNSGMCLGRPGRRPPVRVDIPCIAAAGAWAGHGASWQHTCHGPASRSQNSPWDCAMPAAWAGMLTIPLVQADS